MSLAFTAQKFQDWFTQQWVIFRGRKIKPSECDWLLGPFGELNGIGEQFIHQLAPTEDLIVRRNVKDNGLLSTIGELCLSENELRNLSESVVDFYERTANYNLQIRVKWNLFFKIFGFLVNRLFSERINQLNIPIENIRNSEALTSEIITLVSRENNEVKYTIWLRKFVTTGRIIYSGVYGTSRLPSGITCIKAVFPLPKGNATVIMKPSVGADHELILDASGKKFGDAGFYFLLNDAKGNYWSHYISPFTDRLVINGRDGSLYARQTLKLWKLEVAAFEYAITKTTAGEVDFVGKENSMENCL